MFMTIQMNRIAFSMPSFPRIPLVADCKVYKNPLLIISLFFCLFEGNSSNGADFTRASI